ncbi:MAG: AAA family ATPase [Magnetococcus sp. DMHC-1]
MQLSPGVFLSYCARSPLSVTLGDLLQKRLAAAGFETFLDRFDVQPGEHFVHKIRAAIKQSHAALLLLSPESKESPWSAEIFSFLMMKAELDPDFMILPILMPPFQAVEDFLDGQHALWSFSDRQGIVVAPDKIPISVEKIIDTLEIFRKNRENPESAQGVQQLDPQARFLPHIGREGALRSESDPNETTLELAQEAVQINRGLATQYPDRFLPQLLASLDALAKFGRSTLEGIRIKNFRALRDVTLGRLSHTPDLQPLTPLTVVIGKNGVGKSSFLDFFGFIHDCLKEGVEAACQLSDRSGFNRIRSHGVAEPIEFELCYREFGNDATMTYRLVIDIENSIFPYVREEHLELKNPLNKNGSTIPLLRLRHGKGSVWIQKFFHLYPEEEKIDLTTNKPGISILRDSNKENHIMRLCHYLENWQSIYFNPKVARDILKEKPQKRLNMDGSNLGNIVHYMEKNHQERFAHILQKIAEKIPNINKIETYLDAKTKYLYLFFHHDGFNEPLMHYQMSDGTLRLFSYLLLLEDPEPPTCLCIEEPENGLYHKLLGELIGEFREYATRERKGTQVFIATHQPFLIDAFDPNETWILEKDTDGFSKIIRVSDIRFIDSFVEEGIPLGSLWCSNYFDDR